VDYRDSPSEPAAFLLTEVGEKGDEIRLVLEATACHLILDAEVGRGLEEEHDFRDDGGQAPR
jgi:hypothetical protein